MIEKNHPSIKYGKTGVLIINLGTPDSTKWTDIRKYLKEFLSDRRVIEVNPIIWQIILNLFILNFRPSKTAKAYKEIWMKEENVSPLLYYTKKQTEKISNLLSKDDLIIDFAMRYGNPSIKSKIKPKASLVALGGGYYATGTDNLKRLLENLPKKLYYSDHQPSSWDWHDHVIIKL